MASVWFIFLKVGMFKIKTSNVINQNVDFILKVSPYTVSIILANNLILIKQISSEVEIKKIIADLILEGEHLQAKRFKKCMLLFDFGAISCQKIKINISGKIDFLAIKSKLEDEMNYKLLCIFQGGSEGDYKILKSLVAKKDDIQYLTDMVCSFGIEVLEVKSDFLFAISQIDFEEFVIAKVSPSNFEYAFVENGKVKNYLTHSKFGFENIINELCSIFNKSSDDLIKISSFYKSYSLTERLKIYYSREKEDFKIREMIESNKFISLFNIEVKRIMNRIKNFVYNDLKISEKPIVFYYEESLKNSKIHQSLMNENVFDFESFNMKINFQEERQKMVAIFAGDMKKIFNLSS